MEQRSADPAPRSGGPPPLPPPAVTLRKGPPYPSITTCGCGKALVGGEPYRQLSGCGSPQAAAAGRAPGSPARPTRRGAGVNLPAFDICTHAPRRLAYRPAPAPDRAAPAHLPRRCRRRRPPAALRRPASSASSARSGTRHRHPQGGRSGANHSQPRRGEPPHPPPARRALQPGEGEGAGKRLSRAAGGPDLAGNGGQPRPPPAPSHAAVTWGW